MKATEELKNIVAEKHGFKNGVLGNAWNLAMQVTHRTKFQLELYDELLSETIKQYEEKLRWIPVDEKEPECTIEAEGILYSEYLEIKVKGYEHPVIGYYINANDDQFFDFIYSKLGEKIPQEDVTHFRFILE